MKGLSYLITMETDEDDEFGIKYISKSINETSLAHIIIYNFKQYENKSTYAKYAVSENF